MTRLLFSRRQPHRRRPCHGRPRDVPDAVDVDGRDWALAVLQAVDRHLGDAVVVDEGAGHHEAMEYLMTVELKHAAAAADIDIRWHGGREGGHYHYPFVWRLCTINSPSYYVSYAKLSFAERGLQKSKSQGQGNNGPIMFS